MTVNQKWWYYERMSVLLQNKKANLNFEILESYEAGIELFGFEVKSIRKKQGQLEGAHVTVRGGEVYVLNCTIPPFQPANAPGNYDPARPRRLLLSKKEIRELVGTEKQKGLTIVPLSVYSKGRKLKVEIAVVRGKKKHDKRETIKRKDTERELSRTLKRNIHF